ncbi:cellulose biosynthesis protein BcsP [Paraburkholderia solisilvae]|uniref:Cellulose biosynthesis protein BcsR n=1 Tax=Paraburkholderia solisilvae TaxID=624376 RepID=A0A6J5EZF3_9BURK|nr:cellulose biosynthesis protein BcsP [Paraburkholderia solisilvae]CAB3771969.1 hypothetical protein LMG29739_06170 [Paraburkholderia solisilvae]
MSVSNDIGNLFQRFGGDPERYQEVARDDDTKQAISRWPLLTALDIAHPEPVPDAGTSAATTPIGAAVQPLATATAVTAAAAAAAGTTIPRAMAEHDARQHAAASGMPRAPLFARGHRHATMPPPADFARQAAARFSPPPEPAAAANESVSVPGPASSGLPEASAATTSAAPSVLDATAASRATPATGAPTARAPHEATSTTTATSRTTAPAASMSTTRDASRQPQPTLFSNHQQTFAPTPITPATASAPAGPAESRPAAPSMPRPAATAANTSSTILSGLFAAPAHEPNAKPVSRALTSVFDRLAGKPGRDRIKPGGGRS